MKSENRPLLVVLLAAVIVVAVAGAYFVITALPSSLPLPSGMVIERTGYNVTFTVSGGIGRLLGAWYANHGGTVWIYLSNSPPSRNYMLPCMTNAPWNGTADVSLVPGIYTMAFEPFSLGGTFVITQTVHLAYPGDSPGTNRTLLASWCGL